MKQGSLQVPVIKTGAGLASDPVVTRTVTDPTAHAPMLRAELLHRELAVIRYR
jgi:hypothetical protein